jgi:WD40 repeat protein
MLGVLGRRAEEVYAGLGEAGQATARQLFLRLVALGEGIEDTRRRALRSELEALKAESQAGEMERVIEVFGRIRLISFDREPFSNSPTVEVAHEALLKEWGRLHEWLESSRADLHQQRQLAGAAREWREAGWESSYLLVEQRLALFESWVKGTSVALTREEQDFLDASLAQREAHGKAEAERAGRERRLERRSHLFTRLLAAVLLVAAIGGFSLAYSALRAQRKAEAAQGTAQAEAYSRATQEKRAILEADLRATQQVIAEQQKQEAEAQKQIVEEQKEEVSLTLSNMLVTKALAELEGGDPERAVLLGLEVLENYPYSPQAESALAKAAQEVYPYYFLDPGLSSYSDQGYAVAWSPDGKILAQSRDDFLVLWDAEQQTKLGLIEFMYKGGGKIAWSPDSKYIMTGLCRDSFVAYDASDIYCGIPRIYDAYSAANVRTIGGEGITTTHSLDWSPDGKLLLTTEPDGRAIAWDTGTGKPTLTLQAGQAPVNDARFSPDGKTIATAAKDKNLIVWDSQTGTELYRLKQDRAPEQISWSPDGKLLATFDQDGNGLVWDMDLRSIRFKKAGVIQALTWSGEGRMLITAGRDGIVSFWDASTGYEVFHLQSGITYITGIAFSPVTNQLAVSGAAGSRVQVWDLTPKTATVLPSLESYMGSQQYTMPYDLTWSPDGTRLAGGGIIWEAASGKKLVKLYDVREKVVYKEPQLLVSLEDAVAGRNFQKAPVLDATGYGSWSPDGSMYISFLNNVSVRGENGHIWDLKTFKLIADLPDSAFIFSWSPDGTKYAASLNTGSYKVHVYDSRTFQELYSVGDCASCNVIFPRWSPDGSQLVVGYYNQHTDVGTTIWDGNTGAKLVELPSQDGATINSAWSPDGLSLAVTYENGVIKIWDTANWQVQVKFADHIGGILGIAWSPDGKRLVSSDNSGQVKVWNASDGQEVMSLTGTNEIWQVHWSPDGTMISAAGGNSFPMIRPAWSTTEALVEYVKEHLVWRELTPEERAEFGLP